MLDVERAQHDMQSLRRRCIETRKIPGLAGRGGGFRDGIHTCFTLIAQKTVPSGKMARLPAVAEQES
ncbi:hypothetical protein [Neorhizobium sp. LjRoot104]|uniref:hypothetical protein n=1 Tax=Neorhizobium sp. LjRoot104 TaxID=3342254 RepID=UPI003ECFBDD9